MGARRRGISNRSHQRKQLILVYPTKTWQPAVFVHVHVERSFAGRQHPLHNPANSGRVDSRTHAWIVYILVFANGLVTACKNQIASGRPGESRENEPDPL